MIVGGYVLDLYCRNADPDTGTGKCNTNGRSTGAHEPRTFTARTFSGSKRLAQRAGWVFGRDGDVTCPTCAGGRRRALAAQETDNG